MNELEMFNLPVPFPMAGQTVNVRRVSYAKRRAIHEQCYIMERVRAIKAKAEAAFEDAKARGDYIMAQMDRIPSGNDLAEIVDGLKASTEVITRIFMEATEPKMTYDQAEALIDDSADDEFRAVFAWIKGGKKKSISPPPSGGPSVESSPVSTGTPPKTSGS